MTKSHSKLQQLIVSPQEQHLRLDQYIKLYYPGYSGGLIRKGIEAGLCQINGKRVTFPSTKVRAGQTIRFDIKALLLLDKRQVSIEILYEDEFFAIINKPSGVATEEKSFSSLPWKVFLVHRLDKGTSGCLILAKTENVQRLFEEAFFLRKIKKVYHALVVGSPTFHEKKITLRIGPLRKGMNGQTLYGETPLGKEATTIVRVLFTKAKYSMVECLPETGRTHQIRVHLKAIGFPILGDTLYSSTHTGEVVNAPRLCLHAYSLEFIHPITNIPLLIISKTPQFL